MNTAHLHLIVNHLPIVGIGFALLMNLLAIIGKSIELKKIACWFYILVAILAVFPILTGDGAGEIVKTLPGISNDTIEYHETWGYAFFYGLLVTGILGILGLWFADKKAGLLQKINLAILIIGFILTFFAYEAGSSGGKIHHPEIEQGSTNK